MNAKNIIKVYLILSNDLGYNINAILRKKSDLRNFQVESVIKPEATFQQVVENFDHLTKNFSTNDHVVILAGSNNFNKRNKYPLFRDLYDKIKLCARINSTIATVPLRKNSYLNRFI